MSMSTRSLKTRIIFAFFLVIFVISISIAILGITIIKRNIFDRAQESVERNLRAARLVYQDEIIGIGDALRVVSCNEDMTTLRDKMNLDYLVLLPVSKAAESDNEIVKTSYEHRSEVGGTRILSKHELLNIDPQLVERVRIEIKDTPLSRPTDLVILESAMVKEYAMPIKNENGDIENILYGGRIINGDHVRVDNFKNMVFGRNMYKGLPIGTVTIFQDDIRIATNVLEEDGSRAVGTRVSAEVYKKVVESGKVWHDRAFVVNDWYKSAYEPIKNITGEVIGILYVGTLQKPFDDMAGNIILVFLAILTGTIVLAVILALVLANNISRPLLEMIPATHRISNGDFEHTVKTDTGISGLNKLAESFNEMAMKLEERERSLMLSNQKLEEANKNYIDLISFVSHELKGILASAVMNTYSIRDGFLGMVNFKQQRAINSVARSLDYLTSTVKKFLNLGRVEKGELPVNIKKVLLRKEIFDVSVDSLSVMAKNKKINIVNEIDPTLSVNADIDLLQVVANNLVNNAIKYGIEDGDIIIRSQVIGSDAEIEVYNDSVPISDEQKEKLFKKFSRLNTPETKTVKGTGLGLFITKQIIESHGGSIWVESKTKGNSFIFRIERSI